MFFLCFFVFFQAEDGIRDLVRSRGLGDVYKRQGLISQLEFFNKSVSSKDVSGYYLLSRNNFAYNKSCLLYTSDAADERSSVDLGGRRIIKKKNNRNTLDCIIIIQKNKKYKLN